MLLLGWSTPSSSVDEDAGKIDGVEMLGSSESVASSSTDATERVLDDLAFVDMDVVCKDAFSHPSFRDYISFQHATGTPTASQVSPNVYNVQYDGANVTFFVDYNDVKLEMNAEIVGRQFDLFDTYHERITFVSIPPKSTTTADGGARHVQKGGRRAPSGQNGGDACRAFHSLVAVFSRDAAVTLGQWQTAIDERLLSLRDIVEAIHP